jgi:hypothetical protein
MKKLLSMTLCLGLLGTTALAQDTFVLVSGGTYTMGDLINTKANEYSPFLSPDGHSLFFVRHDGKSRDIYWVDACIVNKFKSN